MFRRLHESSTRRLRLRFENEEIEAEEGDTVAAALLAAGVQYSRVTPVSHSPRAPYCMMGVCFDCLVEIDGVPSQQACQVRVREGMHVRRQVGARSFCW